MSEQQKQIKPQTSVRYTGKQAVILTLQGELLMGLVRTRVGMFDILEFGIDARFYFIQELDDWGIRPIFNSLEEAREAARYFTKMLNDSMVMSVERAKKEIGGMKNG